MSSFGSLVFMIFRQFLGLTDCFTSIGCKEKNSVHLMCMEGTLDAQVRTERIETDNRI